MSDTDDQCRYREYSFGGYPWTLIRMSRRDECMRALQAASVWGQIKPLAELIMQEIREWTPKHEAMR